MSTAVEFGVLQKLLVTEVMQQGRTIFVQLDTPEAYQVQDLSREIETHVSERNRDQLNFNPGSRCYARASDGVLYRALVIAKTSANLAGVYFTDYGNSEEVNVSDIFPPTGTTFDLPAQALCCTLSDFIPNQSKWSDAIEDYLTEQLVNHEVYGIFKSISSSPHPHNDAVLQDSSGRYPSYNVALFQDETTSVSYASLLVEMNRGQFAICNENVSVGTTAKVYVAFSDSPGRFWLQLSTSTPTLDAIAGSLVEASPSLQPLPREAVYPGIACCVEFADDNALYRAVVIEVKSPKVEVQFVDYGNSTTVTVDKILGIPPNLCSIPSQAIQCCLEGVRPVAKDWTPESCDTFAESTVNIELDAEFVDELTPEVFTVILRNPESGTTISEALVDSGRAQSSNPTSLLGQPPAGKKIVQQAPVQTPVLRTLPKEYTQTKLEVGQSYELIITHFDSPSVVWAQLVSHQKVFNDMMIKMSAAFESPALIQGLDEVAPGQPCAAQFSDDRKWYRGRIEAIDEKSKRAQVLFVDFGNSAIFKISNLKQLRPQELILLPTQAVSFSMHDLVPTNQSKVWSRETLRFFGKITSSGTFNCEVVELDGDGYPSVRLRDKKGRDLAEEMVRGGNASMKGQERSRSLQQTRASGSSVGSREPSSGRGREGTGGGGGGGMREGRYVRNESGSREGRSRDSRSRERGSQGGWEGQRRTGVDNNKTVTHLGSNFSSRDSSTRGNRAPSHSSPHDSQSRSSSHSKTLSPIHTGKSGPPLLATKKTQFTSVILEVGSTYDLQVVHVDSLQNFYVQLTEHEEKLTELMDEIAMYCESDDAKMPDNLGVGRPVLAQFTDDQDWYRATVSERNPGVSMVTFVDYGNQDVLPDSGLVTIPPQFMNLSAQAVHCSLDGVGVQVSPEAAKTAFNELTLEAPARGEVKSVLHDSSGPLYSIDLSLSDGSKPITALVEGGHISIPRSTLSNLSPSSSPTLTEVKIPSFPVNKDTEVCLSYAQSPVNFFVQLLENYNRLRQLTSEINEIYCNIGPREEVLFSLNEGVFCAAKFSEDNVWYRARIVGVGGALARVKFVDYGNEEEVPASDLKSLRVQFATEPCLAIQCHLENFPPELTSSEAAIVKLTEFIENNKKLVAKFLQPFVSYSKSIPVQLFDTSLPESERNIADLLRKLHSKPQQSQAQVSAAKPTTDVISMTQNSLSGSKPVLPPVKPVLNRPIECTVTHVESPSEIYCQTVNSTSLAQALLDELYAFYVEQNQGRNLDSPEIGTICAAPFNDGSWYRVRVTAIGSGVLSVQYIDYGNCAEVAVADLRALDPKFLTDAPHCLKCSLNGIQPIGGGQWSADCNSALKQILLDQSCTVAIASLEGETCKCEIMLESANIAQKLCHDEFASNTASNTTTTVEPPLPEATVKTSNKSERDYLTIPPFDSQVGQEMKMFVTFCDFPNLLYCQPKDLDDKFNRLTEEIQVYSNSDAATVVSVGDVIIDDVILAQYSEDNNWYRAQVKEILLDSLRVLFVDYGNSETTNSLRAIPAEFCSMPAQAAPCSILQWNEFDVISESSSFNGHLTSDNDGFRVLFLEAGVRGKISVIQLTRVSDGINVLEQACNTGMLNSKAGSNTSQKGTSSSATATITPSVATDTFPLSVVVETNSREDGFISHLESPSSFWVQLDCNGAELQRLEEGLAAVYGNPAHLAKLALPNPKLGQTCCAQFSDDQQWYRGIVESVSTSGVKVHFIDYGNGEMVSCDLIKVLKEEFLQIPVQAVHCSLIGGVPLTGTDWSADSIASFSSLVMDNAVTVEFVDESEKGVWSVMLNCQKKDVATVMINEGFASPTIQSHTDRPIVQPVQNLPAYPEYFDPSLESSQARIPDMKLRVGESYEVYISHMTDSPREFYCQLMNNEETIKELMAAVADFYIENSLPVMLEAGRYCVAKYSNNRAWHRAKIVEVDVNAREGGGGGGGEELVRVQFVDHGNGEVVASSDVMGLSPALGALAKQAIPCSILDDPNFHLSDESIARFLEIDTNLCYRILVTGCLDDGRYLVELSDFNGTVLNNEILRFSPVTPPLTTSSDNSTLIFKPLSYPPPSTLDVYVSFILSPTNFYCQPLELADILDRMMQDLVHAVTGGNLESVTSASPGTCCLAPYSDDNDWYRARVESVSDNGTDVTVHFVDYGNSETTAIASLLTCPPFLFKVPIQALHCSVFDSHSAAGIVEWNDDSIEMFKTLLGEDAISLRVMEIEERNGCSLCSVECNGSQVDFIPLLKMVGVDQIATDIAEVGRLPVTPGDQEVVQTLPTEPPYSSLSSSSSLPATAAISLKTSSGKMSENSTQDGKDLSDGNGLLLPNVNLQNLSTSGNINFSTLALKGSSHASGENLSETETSEEASDQGDGEGEPLIKAPFTLTLSVPEEFEALVVYVESPSFLFLQRLDCQTELERLSVEMEQYCASFAEKQHQEIFQEGDFVLAKYSLNDAWYRAKVVETGTDTGFQVFFIDYGNSEIIAPDKMVMCSECYLELPCQAIACSLANVPRRDLWPEEYKNLIDEKIGDRTVRVKVVHPALKGMRPTVNIEDKETGDDLAQTVLDYLHEECERGNISNYVIPEEPEEEEEEEEEEVDTPDHITPKVVAADSTELVLPTSAKLTTLPMSDDGQKVRERNSIVPNRKLEIGSTHQIFVASCETPHSFFVQLANETEYLNQVSAALESEYENTDTSKFVLPGVPGTGDYVCAQFSEDSKWYRARVVGIDSEDQSRAELLFIDFGNRETSEISNLRSLSTSLPSLPPLALECFLAGVEPSEGQCSFSPEAGGHLLELTGHGETECKLEVQFTDSAGHYGVNLIGVEGVNVAQSLFDAHLATTLQDTPATTTTNDETKSPQCLDSLTTEVPITEEDPLPEKPAPMRGSDNGGENGVKLSQYATAYPPNSLEPGSSYNAVIINVTNLDNFDCQLTDNIDKLDRVMELIESRDYQVGDGVLAVTEPRRGMAVCACFTEEDVWYRAEITRVISHQRVCVTYVDYGNSEELDRTRLKMLESDFCCALPPLMVNCSLLPLTDRDLDPSRPLSQGSWDLVWPKECSGQFQEMIGDSGETRLEILESQTEEGEGGRGGGGEGAGLIVKVFVNGRDGEIDVREALIRRILDAPKSEILHSTVEEADGGYGDSVTEGGEEEGGGGGGQAEISSSLSPKESWSSPEAAGTSSVAGPGTTGVGYGAGDFDRELEETVKRVAGLAITNAQRDLKEWWGEESLPLDHED